MIKKENKTPFIFSLLMCVVVVLTVALPAFAQHPASARKMRSLNKGTVEERLAGQLDGKDVIEYTLTNPSGMQVRVMTYGATITDIVTPDRSGELASVVLGLDSLSHYAGWQNSLMGSTVGRVAGRIENGRFTLDGKEYILSSDIHGGKNGFDKRHWTGKTTQLDGAPAVEMSYLSKDGEEGFPGSLSVRVTFSLNKENELLIDYKATTDKATPLVLTNHSYFNLSGGKSHDALNTELTVFADQYLGYGEGSMPTGEILNVKNTAFDFTSSKTIGQDIDKVQQYTSGYDVTFALRNPSGALRLAARAFEPLSGREMEVYTTEPGLVFYSGNYLSDKVRGRNGVPYTKNGAFCLETQHYPNSVHNPEFPDTILRPGVAFHSQTIYKFAVRN
jgi:aldose 1-epimerase